MLLIEGKRGGARRLWRGGGNRRRQPRPFRARFVAPAPRFSGDVAVPSRAGGRSGANHVARRAAARRTARTQPQQLDPERVIVFSGHMIDDPPVAAQARTSLHAFPSEKADAAAKESQPPSTRSAREPAILAYAAAPAAATSCSPKRASRAACGWSCAWRERSRVPGQVGHLRRSRPSLGAVLRRRRPRIRRRSCSTMPDELGPAPAGMTSTTAAIAGSSYIALSQGLQHASFVTLWDRRTGRRSGRHGAHGRAGAKADRPSADIIDPKTL